jgi:hypothetical protein
LYSFDPVISESISYDGDRKSAIAISGIDNVNNVGLSVTKQNRINNTRSSSAVEFFDRFDTHVVALDSQVAKYESDAAELRTTFSYRATAEVLGNPNLRPDIPVFIQGVSGTYDGYWTILGVEHRVVEEQRNTQRYTTILHLGTDALGQATTWVDGKQILGPTTTPTRIIVPGVRQTSIVPKSALIKNSPNAGPQSTGPFGVAKNRTKPNTFKLPVNSPVWSTKTSTLNPVSQPAGSSAPKSNPRATKKIAKIQ